MPIRLDTLDPKWLLRGDRRVGVVFTSPTDKAWRQVCMFVHASFREQITMCQMAIHGEAKGSVNVQTADPKMAWTCIPQPLIAGFDNMTIVPSIDGSRAGLWHGHITNGMVVGGV